jgi:hypothetical protein
MENYYFIIIVGLFVAMQLAPAIQRFFYIKKNSIDIGKTYINLAIYNKYEKTTLKYLPNNILKNSENI